MTIRKAIDQRNLRIARDALRDYKSRYPNALSQEFWNDLARMKQKAVIDDDQMTAKAVWCLETIGHIQDSFVSAFGHIQANEFMEAWERLVSCENEISFLDGHLTELADEFGIEHVRIHTKQFQQLFPLKWGVSPGILSKEIRCSICGTKRTLRSNCIHRSGEIYDGEMCGYVAEKWELLHIALTDNPVQKSTMIFPNGNDDPLLSSIKKVSEIVGTPWRSWVCVKEVRRQHHPVFKNVGRNDLCPCRSGLKFKRCCLNKELIEEFPHLSVNVLS